MGTDSGIQWTTHTLNPWVGCEKVSAGCTHCYAETYDKRVGGVPKKKRPDPTKPLLRWGPNGMRTRTSPSTWKKAFLWDSVALQQSVNASIRGLEKPPRPKVFCASLADVFEDNRKFPLDLWRLELFEVIRTTPHLDWQLLTKRPENVLRLLSAAGDQFGRAGGIRIATVDMLQDWMDGKPPPNVWLGCTVEDQAAQARLPVLMQTPAVVHFLSCEPLLQGLDLTPWYRLHTKQLPDWVIVGGESGDKARPFHVCWARQIVEFGAKKGIPVFVKQMGAKPWADGMINVDGLRLRLKDKHGGDPAEWPEGLNVRQFPGPSLRMPF